VWGKSILGEGFTTEYFEEVGYGNEKDGRLYRTVRNNQA
jgi:hypothetical protein